MSLPKFANEKIVSHKREIDILRIQSSFQPTDRDYWVYSFYDSDKMIREEDMRIATQMEAFNFIMFTERSRAFGYSEDVKTAILHTLDQFRQVYNYK